jgi:hypothetical protein
MKHTHLLPQTPIKSRIGIARFVFCLITIYLVANYSCTIGPLISVCLEMGLNIASGTKSLV